MGASVRPLAVAAALVITTRADAQEATPDAAATPAPAPAPVAEEARARYRRGIELFDEGDYRLALVELERAYAMVANYKILYNVAQVHLQLNEYARARAVLERYLTEGGDDIPASRRAEVERDLATVRSRVATLTVETNVPGVEVTVNEQSVGAAPIRRAVVDAGSLRIQASKPGYATQARSLKLAGGDDAVVRFDLVPSTPNVVVANEGLPTMALVGWIATGVLAAGAVGTGIAANAAASRYETRRASPIEGSPEAASAALARDRDLVTGLAVTTDALLLASLVAGGVSLYLTLRGNPKPESARVRVHGRAASFAIGF